MRSGQKMEQTYQQIRDTNADAVSYIYGICIMTLTNPTPIGGF